ncbi:MAG: DUF861 domain-containing protein [Betaproteobacteria bacterium]|nr:DUF861 domain-containing protein [Betaproteobacteria bacterium]MDE2048472.1 DUF861 domain-containing protein [Betaproteobacteria bacterium]
MPLLKFSERMPGVPAVDYPKPEALLTGKPRRETWNLIDEGVGEGRLYCGVWTCEPGKWRIAMGPQERELFTVLEGYCRITGDGGAMQEAGPGEAVFIPAGFKGTFEVIQKVTKTYAIFEG